MFSKFLFTRALFQILSQNYDNWYVEDNMDPDRPELYTTEKEKNQYFKKSANSLNRGRKSKIVNLSNQQKHFKKKIISKLVRKEFSKRKPSSSLNLSSKKNQQKADHGVIFYQ